jgi:prephenate dehydratase
VTDSTKIAFQGALGAFSHQAAKAFALRQRVEATYVPCQTFGQVFDNVVNGGTKYGAIPLENSSIGSISANYDLLWAHEARIIDEYFLPVHHSLIGFPDASLIDIRTVFSHPAALDQCRAFFKNHPEIAARVHWDTSGAVADIAASGDRSAAAIAGELAAEEYKMKVLLPNIEDFEHNATRFGLISTSTAQIPPGPQEEIHKVSYAFELGHRVGSLSALLAQLAEVGVNLTKIESRPIGETPWHYRFFVDILDSEDKEMKLQTIFQRATDKYKYLGRYPAGVVEPAPSEG